MLIKILPRKYGNSWLVDKFLQRGTFESFWVFLKNFLNIIFSFLPSPSCAHCWKRTIRFKVKTLKLFLCNILICSFFRSKNKCIFSFKTWLSWFCFFLQYFLNHEWQGHQILWAVLNNSLNICFSKTSKPVWLFKYCL